MQLVETREGFDTLAAEWSALFARAGRPGQMFQTHNWLWHWANHFLPKDCTSLAIVTLRCGGRLVGVLPLAVERAIGLRQLVFMGAPVSQYGDAIVEPGPDTERRLTEALHYAIGETRADLVRLAKVRDDAAIVPALAKLNAPVTSQEEAPFIDIAAAKTFAAYEQRFSNKARKNRRRLERRLEERGPVEAQWLDVGQPAADGAMVAMVLKRAWLKTRGRISKAFADPRIDAFFAAAARSTDRPAGLDVALLRSAGEVANAAVSVTVKGHQAVHILAYGLKFEKSGVGVLHVEKLIARAFETGVTTFDFLAPRHDYKMEWADGAVRVADYALPASAAGKAYTNIYLLRVREAIKAAVASPPVRLKGALSFVQSMAGRLRR